MQLAFVFYFVSVVIGLTVRFIPLCYSFSKACIFKLLRIPQILFRIEKKLQTNFIKVR